jgi:hypothetical protein
MNAPVPSARLPDRTIERANHRISENLSAELTASQRCDALVQIVFCCIVSPWPGLPVHMCLRLSLDKREFSTRPMV